MSSTTKGDTTMTISIKRDTFQALGKNCRDITIGTVQLDLGREVVTAKAFQTYNGEISVAGFIGRYRTSNTPWLASVKTRGADNMLSVDFGRDDRSGRFNKQNAISWEPEIYEKLIDTNFWYVV
jgi:hypothetical protein